MSVSNFNIKGLTQKEVLLAREKYGKNTLNFKQESGFLTSLKSLLKDPMIILLVAASSIYLISGATVDGIFFARLHIYLPLFAKFFQFEKLNSTQLIFSVAIGFFTVIWYEAIKWRKRKTKPF